MLVTLGFLVICRYLTSIFTVLCQGRVVHATVVTVLSGAGARREIVNRRGLVLALDDLRGQARLRGRERPSRKYGYA